MNSKALNFSFQIQGHLKTFKFCTNPAKKPEAEVYIAGLF